VRELDELASHDAVEAVDAGDAIPDGDDGPDLGHINGGLETFDLAADDIRDLGGFDLHVLPLFDLDLFAQAIQLSCQRAVKDPRTNLKLETPKEIPVGFEVGYDLGALDC